MEFQDVVRRRRMVRDFSDEPVARPLVEQLMVNATRIPSAGYSQGFAFVVLTDPGQRRLFWETTSGPEWRGESESVALTRAPVVIVPLAHKQSYLDRYAQPDKAHTPLSRGALAGAVPFEPVGIERAGASREASHAYGRSGAY
jgi:nitroreductase